MDKRIRANEFMEALSIGKSKFYAMVASGQIAQPIRATCKDVFWYESYVKSKVEEYKCDNIAHA